MVTLTASNLSLTKNAKYSYLNDNYLSGVSSFVISNSNGFTINDYLLLGEFGSETAEIVQISTVTSATHTIALTSTTKFAHAESTKITIIPYNQVRFYHTTTATFGTSDPVTDYIDIQADDTVTKTIDSINASGFGWFVFYNSTTTSTSASSNAIPYSGFTENSVRTLIDSFFSQLNNKEQKLVTYTDALRWLNEGYAKAKNKLNLVDNNYNVAGLQTISVTSGTQEWDLNDDLGEIINVWDDTHSVNVDTIDMKDVSNNDENTGNTIKYYIRSGTYIGFSPTPTESLSIKIRYKTKATALTTFYDSVDLPNNNHYVVINFMMFRACPKLNRSNSIEYLNLFEKDIKDMILTSRQNRVPESFSIDTKAFM